MTDKKYRDGNGLFLCEGVKLLREALAAKAEIAHIFVTQGAADEPDTETLLNKLSEESINIVSDSVFERISTEKAPQGIICTVRHLDKLHKNITIYNNADERPPRRALILDAVSDPGNLGTIIRTAAAFGVDELVIGQGCADIYNPRTVRASMGALFRQKITRAERLAESVTALRTQGVLVYAATLDAEYKIDELFPLKDNTPLYIIIGNEGHGISPEIIAAANSTVTIPIMSGAESLNAAVAASIFMWQMSRVKADLSVHDSHE